MSYLRLLRQRSVLVLWLAQSLSVLGDRLYALAVMWVVYAATGSASLMGLIAVVESLPYVVLGTAGRHAVARFSTFGRLAWVDAARALVAVALPFLWSPDAQGVALLLVGVLLLGTLGALFDPNLGALVPDLVEPARVQQVTGLFDLTGRIARIAGPASIGLLLLVVSEAQLFALNGVTFAVSAVALGWLARRYALAAGAEGAEQSGGARPAVQAWPTVRAHPRVGLAIGVHGVALFCSAVTAVGMPALLATRYGAGAAVYGLVTAAVGVGALLGNPLASNRRPSDWMSVYCAAWVVQGVATACMGLVLSLPVLLLLAGVTGLVTPATSVTLRARLGVFAPAERLRLMSVDQTVIRAGGTAGMLMLPFLVDASPRGAFVAGGGIVAGTALGALLVASRALRPDAALPVPAAARGRAVTAE
ncbi:MFS transporter [Streptomyces sp. NPDC053048]|uniref:MFS transporter n=1 Tax=Streptomyces sp. NPDC053048 TaxID=3365694 RepID=UPI0037D3A33A